MRTMRAPSAGVSIHACAEVCGALPMCTHMHQIAPLSPSALSRPHVCATSAQHVVFVQVLSAKPHNPLPPPHTMLLLLVCPPDPDTYFLPLLPLHLQMRAELEAVLRWFQFTVVAADNDACLTLPPTKDKYARAFVHRWGKGWAGLVCVAVALSGLGWGCSRLG